MDASDSRNEQPSKERTVMKNRALAGLVVVGILMSGAAFSLLAQNGPAQGRNGCGKGYGGPPQSQEERAARQAACQEQGAQCQGPCVTGQPRGQGRGMGWGARNGGGLGYRHGLRDGTGPRSANGTCPNAPVQSQK